jgi:superoxide dismutase, Fe-Mn family
MVMTVTLIPLPYAIDALEPHISQRTLEFHHGAHHKAYVDKTNEAIADTNLADAGVNEIVKASLGNPKLFNNVSQVWNHGFYWNSLTPEKTSPDANLQAAIDRDFGSFDELKEKLAAAAVGHFASGWAWLVSEGGKLAVKDTHDAHSPFSEDAGVPLLTIDVWEHAYYLDVQNKRPEYVKRVLDQVLNWSFASENFTRGTVWQYP